MAYKTGPKKEKPPQAPEVELKRLLGRFNLTLSVIEQADEDYLQTYVCSVLDEQGVELSERWTLSLRSHGAFDLLSEGQGVQQARVIAGLLQNVKDWVVARHAASETRA